MTLTLTQVALKFIGHRLLAALSLALFCTPSRSLFYTRMVPTRPLARCSLRPFGLGFGSGPSSLLNPCFSCTCIDYWTTSVCSQCPMNGACWARASVLQLPPRLVVRVDAKTANQVSCRFVASHGGSGGRRRGTFVLLLLFPVS